MGGSQERALLSARGVSRSFGEHRALAPTSLEVHAGDMIAVIGPNGAGKSTLVSIMAGALDPTGGEVSEGEPPPRIGWVPQRPSMYGRLSPRENLELFARLESVADPAAAAGSMLTAVGLPDDGRPAGTLSIGNQQRLNLGIALLGRPDVLLLDEPTAALDPRHRRLLWELAAVTAAEGGAVLFVTQNLEELERFATRVVVLRDGELIFDGTRDEYHASPEAQVFA